VSDVTLWRAGTDTGGPLVVLLHGRGGDEVTGLALADGLPEGLDYVALRAPIFVGDGYGWFERADAGRPDPASLRTQLDRFRAWRDEVAPAPRPVTLIGFSMGAIFAAAAALDEPSRYAGVAVLYGPVPFDAGLDTSSDRLGALDVFHAQGSDDDVFPAALAERTWWYLSRDAGANAVTHRHPGGHAISPEVATSLAYWVSHHAGGAGGAARRLVTPGPDAPSSP
jgi:phospholipase/carboxylesterase